MNDDTLLNISIIVCIIGLIALLIISFYDKMPQSNFNDITSQNVGYKVKSFGEIKQINVYNSSIILKVKQECLMDVVIFDKNHNFNVNDNISIQGTAQEFNGKMEIVADKIVKN